MHFDIETKKTLDFISFSTLQIKNDITDMLLFVFLRARCGYKRLDLTPRRTLVKNCPTREKCLLHCSQFLALEIAATKLITCALLACGFAYNMTAQVRKLIHFAHFELQLGSVLHQLGLCWFQLGLCWAKLGLYWRLIGLSWARLNYVHLMLRYLEICWAACNRRQ